MFSACKQRPLLEEMGVDLRRLVNFHFLSERLVDAPVSVFGITYHLERVELLFDLLSKHRSQTIASGYLTTTIVFSTWPRIMEL